MSTYDDALVANLSGGLGNQLFIFAAAYAQAQRLDCRLVLDASTYANPAGRRRYELDFLEDLADETFHVPAELCQAPHSRTTADWTDSFATPDLDHSRRPELRLCRPLGSCPCSRSGRDPELSHAASARHRDQRGLGIVETGQRRGVLLHLSDRGINAALQTLSVGVAPLGVTDETHSHQADHQIDPDAGISDHNHQYRPRQPFSAVADPPAAAPRIPRRSPGTPRSRPS